MELVDRLHPPAFPSGGWLELAPAPIAPFILRSAVDDRYSVGPLDPPTGSVVNVLEVELPKL